MRIANGPVLIALGLSLTACAGPQRQRQQREAAERALKTAESDYRAAFTESNGLPQSQVRLAENDLKAARSKFTAKKYLEARETSERASRLAKQAQQAAIEAKKRHAEEQRRQEEQARASKAATPTKEPAGARKKKK